MTVSSRLDMRMSVVLLYYILLVPWLFASALTMGQLSRVPRLCGFAPRAGVVRLTGRAGSWPFWAVQRSKLSVTQYL